MTVKRIKNALISVYHKDGLEEIIKLLHNLEITLYSTGGTYDFIKNLGYDAIPVEKLTSYPSILGGRVKTLHPKIFGGILYRRDHPEDIEQVGEYEIPDIDLVIVDLYPFAGTVATTTDEEAIIEKIDIGGISLIRAAAKNHKDVAIVASIEKYEFLTRLLKEKGGYTSLEDRKELAIHAFHVSSHYDASIYKYLACGRPDAFVASYSCANHLRYGENPHQEAVFYGNLENVFLQLHGKEISYNNLGDLDAAIHLINEFQEPTVAILKHTNACGLASRPTLAEAWRYALAGDPVSAFGGVIIINVPIDAATAEEINKLFFEVLLAPDYEKSALELLKSKKNRILLQGRSYSFQNKQFRSLLDGVIVQDKDLKSETVDDLRVVTKVAPGEREKEDLLFANKIVKHTKSNAIVLAKNKQLIGSGTGQTSRVDALKQAIQKARDFNFDLEGSVMASDAFFPFADSVSIAYEAGIRSVLQPGGSVRDQETIDFCNDHSMAMVFTGTRHFKH